MSSKLRTSSFIDARARENYLARYEAMLQQWPTYERVDVDGRYGRTVALVTGPASAPPLVLLHGRYTPSPAWAPIIHQLAEHYRVYAIDTMGEPGLSVNDGVALRKRSDYVAWLTETFDGLGIESAHLCGHSFGGWVAARFAVDRPDRVATLTLLDPAQVFAPFTLGWLLACVLPFLRPTRPNVEGLFRRMGSDRPALRDVVDLATQGMLSFQLRAPEAMRILASGLKRLPMPTQQLIAEHTIVHSPRRALRNAKRVNPAVRSHLVEDSSHLIVHDEPDQVVAAIRMIVSDSAP